MKRLLRQSFSPDGALIKTVEDLEQNPDSEGCKTTLQGEVNAAGADQYPDIKHAAQALLDQIKAQPGGERHIQTAIGHHTAQADRSGRLNNRGLDLYDRYAYSGQLADLEAAIEAFQQAVDATPPNSPDRAISLNNLGTGLHDRYDHNGQLADLEGAIEAYQQAIDATPTDSPDRAMYLNNLGTGLRDRFGRYGQLADLQAAKSTYREACKIGLEAALEVALYGARNWGNWALERHAWEEATVAYDYGAKTVDRLLETQLLRNAKEIWLREVQGLAANAAYALARTGDLERAIETIEGGRARLLAEALEHNRHDLEQLLARGHGELLARYQQAAARWAALTTEMERPSQAPLLDASARRGALAEARAELDAVVKAIRQVPGYNDFLCTSTFARIQNAVWEAPLVYLIATPVGGLALIVPPIAEDSDGASISGVQAVWLDALTDAAVRKQIQGPENAQEPRGYLGAYARWCVEPRNPEACAHWLNSLETTTRWLWDNLMGPLIAALEPMAVRKVPSALSAVLIPTGLLGLLPLHAAWTEDTTARNGRRYALDIATLRYAPNARALTAAQALADKNLTERLLLTVEPQPVSASPLPATEREAINILRYWPQGSYTDRWHMAATHKELVTQLLKHTYLHFAGHAFAGWDEPQKGGLLMGSNQVLSIKEFTGMQLSLRLAILSACETGVPGIQLLDEVIGLPTALMEAGVAGVVASLWTVADDSTAQLMAHFHRLWRQEGLAPSEALRCAQIRLREGYAHPFYWGAFTYTGV